MTDPPASACGNASFADDRPASFDRRFGSVDDCPASFGEIHVRTRVDPETTLSADIQRAVRGIDPTLPLYDVRTLDDRLGDTLGRRRIATWLIGVFASLALALRSVHSSASSIYW